MFMHVNAEAALALLKSPRPDINELEDIAGDILQDDPRATEVIRRVRSLLKKAPSGGSALSRISLPLEGSSVDHRLLRRRRATSTIGHLWDMATGPDDVRFQGKTGSGRPTTKLTRITQRGHR